MPTLSSLGVTGFNSAGILEQLKAAEQTRLTPYTNLQSSYKNKLTAWGKISGALSSLQTTVKKLNGEAFNTLTVSDNKAFKATATSEAAADSHSVTVKQLAVSHKLKTHAYPSADKNLGDKNGAERTITITQANGKEVKVTLKDDETSLNQIAKAINKQDGDVGATVQRSDDGYQLILSSRTSGTDGEMSVSVTGDDALANILNTSAGGQRVDPNNGNAVIDGPGKNDRMISVAEAQDAQLKVDGISCTRSSNNVSGVITGVTLNLTSVSENGASEQLTLNADTSAIKTTLQDFVKQYNALLTQPLPPANLSQMMPSA